MSCENPTTNPVPLPIRPGTTIHAVCLSNAAFFQQVILSFNQNLSQRIGTFSGVGENVPMKLANGQTVLTIPTGSNQTLFAQFNFSQSGPRGPFQPAIKVCEKVFHGPHPTFTVVTSEDDVDDDDNDSFLTVVDLNAADKSLEVKKTSSYA